MADRTALPRPGPAGAPSGVAPPPGSAAPAGLSDAERHEQRATTLATLALLAGLGLSLWAQQQVVKGASPDRALLDFGAALACFVFGLWRTTGTGLLVWRGPLAAPEAVPGGSGAAGTGAAALPAAVPHEAATSGRRRWPALGISWPRLASAVALGLVTFLAAGGNAFTVLNVTTWTASAVLALAAGWEPAPRWPNRADLLTLARRLRVPASLRVRLSWTAVALALITAAGAFLLFYRISDVPPEMISDHAEKLLDVQDILDGQHHIFFPRNTGREPFHFYWLALLAHATGISYLTLKVGSAFWACFTIPATFFFARLLFGTPVGLLAAAIVATSRWNLIIGRAALRTPYPALCAAVIMSFLFRAIRDRRRNDFLLCGLALGLTQYTYMPVRIAPVGVLACLGIALAVDLWRREALARVRRLVADSALLCLVAGLTFVPLARYAYDNPNSFFFRGLSRISGDPGMAAPPNPLVVFLGNVKNAFLMFNWKGDVAWVNNISGERVVDPVGGALFALGAAYLVYRIFRYRELPYVYLLVLLFVAFLPSTLSIAFPVENPGNLRMSMGLPIAAVIIALPLWLVARRVQDWLGGRPGQWGATALVAVLLTAILRGNFDQYFRVFPRQYALNSQHTADVARAVTGFVGLGGRLEDAHVIPWPYWVDTRLVAINSGDIRWHPELERVDDARKDDGVPRPRLYILHPDDKASLDALARWYPGSIRQVQRLTRLDGRPYFVTVLVPAGTAAIGP